VATTATMKDTGDIRAKLLEIWSQVDDKKMSLAEARVHISLARAILDTLKVEIAAAHLSQAHMPSVPLEGGIPLRRQRGALTAS
jgi:hypothetical protein